MTMKLFALGLGTALLLTIEARAETVTPPPPSPPTVQAASTPPVPIATLKADPKPEATAKVCHYEDVAGSMIPKKICH